MIRVGGAAFPHDVVDSIDLVMPRAAVPVVGPDEIQDAAPRHIDPFVGLDDRSAQHALRIGAERYDARPKPGQHLVLELVQEFSARVDAQVADIAARPGDQAPKDLHRPPAE